MPIYKTKQHFHTFKVSRYTPERRFFSVFFINCDPVVARKCIKFRKPRSFIYNVEEAHRYAA